MANNPNLIVGRLEYFSPNTDGSFAICVAGGSGTFVSLRFLTVFDSFFCQTLYESIPEEHRPVLNTSDTNEVTFGWEGTLKPSEAS
ncbi:hypothetical protein C8J56DRAFT_948421 [Mycena floridula]|nr:hypothetical protein C8J56DRAFT_948421 [Mycena floridula]